MPSVVTRLQLYELTIYGIQTYGSAISERKSNLQVCLKLKMMNNYTELESTVPPCLHWYASSLVQAQFELMHGMFCLWLTRQS